MRKNVRNRRGLQITNIIENKDKLFAHYKQLLIAYNNFSIRIGMRQYKEHFWAIFSQ